MTFCPFYQQCQEDDHCFRALTPLIEKKAEMTKMPISLFSEKPDCFEPKDN
jgi:hypothetical protein